MNTNSNTYTVIYSIGLVVIVAAVLAFVAKFLQPMQEANVKKDTISQILTAADIEYTDDNVLDVYKENIDKAILVKVDGENWDKVLDINACEIYTNSQLKEQTVTADADKMLPVYIFKNGITVIPCYGAGLWGPVWGYIGLESDLETIKIACFGHKGETPGLGAKITDEPAVFANLFKGKKVGKGDVKFEVKKSADPKGTSEVNAISGATITSTAAGNMVNQWFGFYQNYFAKNTSVKQAEDTAEVDPQEPVVTTDEEPTAVETEAAEATVEVVEVVEETPAN